MQELNRERPCAAKEEITIPLAEDTVNYLQRLDYELAGLQVLHTHALRAGVPLEQRMEVRRQFQEVFAEYQLAKDEMWAQFAPEHPRFKSWRVDFQTGLLHIVEAKGGGKQEGYGHG